MDVGDGSEVGVGNGSEVGVSDGSVEVLLKGFHNNEVNGTVIDEELESEK